MEKFSNLENIKNQINGFLNRENVGDRERTIDHGLWNLIRIEKCNKLIHGLDDDDLLGRSGYRSKDLIERTKACKSSNLIQVELDYNSSNANIIKMICYRLGKKQLGDNIFASLEMIKHNCPFGKPVTMRLMQPKINWGCKNFYNNLIHSLDWDKKIETPDIKELYKQLRNWEPFIKECANLLLEFFVVVTGQIPHELRRVFEKDLGLVGRKGISSRNFQFIPGNKETLKMTSHVVNKLIYGIERKKRKALINKIMELEIGAKIISQNHDGVTFGLLFEKDIELVEHAISSLNISINNIPPTNISSNKKLTLNLEVDDDDLFEPDMIKEINKMIFEEGPEANFDWLVMLN